MTIKEQIKQTAVDRLFSKYVNQYRCSPAWAFGQLKEVVKTTDILKIKEITDATADTKLVRAHLRGLAEAEADELLADDALNLNELKRIFG